MTKQPRLHLAHPKATSMPRISVDANLLHRHEQSRLMDQADTLFQRMSTRSSPSQPGEARRFLILSTPRTGSTFLSRKLDQTENLGWTHEWFNWQLMQHICSRLGLAKMMFRQYLAFLDEAASSDNKIYGINLHIHQYLFLLKKKFDVLKRVDFERIYWLEREDRIAQAYSWTKALKTRCWSRDAEIALGFPDGFDVDIQPSEVATRLADICRDTEYYTRTLRQSHTITREFTYRSITKNQCVDAVNSILSDFDRPLITEQIPTNSTTVQTKNSDRERIQALKQMFVGP